MTDGRPLESERMPPRLRILFLCTGNSCRSQMAEAWTRKLHPQQFEAHSAGTHPDPLDSRTVRVMAEAGIDMSNHRSKHLDELIGMNFDYVLTVCDSAREICPVFPGNTRRIHAGFDDPARLAIGVSGEEEALIPYRRVRDQIRDYVANLPELPAIRSSADDTLAN